MSVADEIRRQLGHKALFMMGAHNMFSDDAGDALVFSIRLSKTWSRIRIKLNANDLYTIKFYKVGRAPDYRITQKEVNDVFVENLHQIISDETGLALSI